MKTFLTISFLTILSATYQPVRAGTAEDLKQARQEKKELCLTIPSCKEEISRKKEARQAKALAKVQAEISALKTLKN